MAIGKWSGIRLPELALSLFALVAILQLLDIRKVFQIISQANVFFVLVAMCAYFSTVLLMTFRIRFVLSGMNHKISYWDSFCANIGGLLASDFTPSRSGYFLTPLLLSKNAGVPVEKGMMAIVGPQIAEFFIKALGAAAAIFLIISSFPNFSGNAAYLWAGVGVILAFCAVMYAALFVPQFLLIAKKFEFIPYVPEGIAFLGTMQANRESVMPIFPQIFGISIAIFFIKGIEWYFFGQALGIGFSLDAPPLLVFMVLQPLVTVFQFVPVPTVAGLGLAEGSAAASMAIMGVPVELAVVYALLVRGGTALVNSPGVTQLVAFLFPKGSEKPEA